VTRVVWTFAALADLHAIRRYIAGFNPHAARVIAARIIEAADSLDDFPNRGRLGPDERVRELTPIYPYVIRYRVTGKRVIVLRVRHGRQRPE
jgi:toxin ParE1/3/4